MEKHELSENTELTKQKCHICDTAFENLDIHYLTSHPQNEGLRDNQCELVICVLMGQLSYRLCTLRIVNEC